MATFKFVLRPSSKTGRHPGSISLRVVHGRKPKTVSICCRLFPEEWDGAMQAILYPADDFARVAYLTGVHEKITNYTEKVNEIIKKMERRGYYTAGDVIDNLRRATDNSKLTGYAATLAEELIERGQYRTAKAYGTVCRRLVMFNRGADIHLEQINGGIIKRFEMHLKESGRLPNTISYYMRNLRAIYNKAIVAGLVSKDEKPFLGVYTGVEETKKRALTADQVNRLWNIDFGKLLQKHDPGTRQFSQFKNLDRSWRLFFFCLYAQGMCFVDLCFLKKGNLQGEMIRYYRKKTGKQIEVPVNDGMREIIESFAPQTEGSDYLFPLLRDGGDNPRRSYETVLRTQNRRLKKLVELAGLNEGIATHVARHSWASILKNKMQPLSVISEGLGHSSEKMTRKYLDSFEHSVLEEAGRTLLSAISSPSDSFPTSL